MDNRLKTRKSYKAKHGNIFTNFKEKLTKFRNMFTKDKNTTVLISTFIITRHYKEIKQ